MREAPAAPFWSRTRRLLALPIFTVSLGACGDMGDPVLVSCDIELNEEVVQTIDIDITGSNFFNDDVHPNSRFLLGYDEPVDLPSAAASISIEDAADNVIPTTITQRLVDVIVTPNASLSTGLNHTLRVNSGIDDESQNTTDYYVNITFYVDQ